MYPLPHERLAIYVVTTVLTAARLVSHLPTILSNATNLTATALLTAARPVPERQRPGGKHSRAGGCKLRGFAETISWRKSSYGKGAAPPKACPRPERAGHREEQLARGGMHEKVLTCGIPVPCKPLQQFPPDITRVHTYTHRKDEMIIPAFDYLDRS